MKTVSLLYGTTGLALNLPDDTQVLHGRHVDAVADPADAVRRALAHPIGAPPLVDLVRRKQPRTVAITISDITRPVPNRDFLPPLVNTLNTCGIADSQIVLIVGTGLHRRSTPEEHRQLIGDEMLRRLEIIDHDAHDENTLIQVSHDPPVHVCRRFAEADFRIVTGYIEGHFMAGFSGGRKGVCPALVDLRTVQRFHGYATLSHPKADFAQLDGNPCHDIALSVARTVGVDFLLNVTITRDRRIAAVFAGDLEAAHAAGCRHAAEGSTATINQPFDLVLTSAGGYPLDLTFYQSVKGLVAALPALRPDSTVLEVSDCSEGLGSHSYAELMLSYNNDWRRFLADIAQPGRPAQLDQWQYQMHTRLLERVGVERVRLVSDGIPPDVQRRLSVNPVLGSGDARRRAQRFVDEFLRDHPGARIAAIPDGPYTMLAVRSAPSRDGGR